MDFDEVKSVVEEFFNGQYEVKKFLGAGSFAEVYLVKHNFLDDLRAMKIVNQPLDSSVNTKEIFHEVMLATQLRHENIISIYDAGVISSPQENKAYFVMEYVPGGDLDQYLNSFIYSNLFMPINLVLELIKQILNGLNTLHMSNPTIIHRDLKLNNILLSYNSSGDIVIKISDFGFAKEVTTNLHDIEVAGTRPYMAPECFNKVSTTMTDMYAVGVIFYQLLTNHFPYDVDEYSTGDLLLLKPWKNQIKAPSFYNDNVSKEIDDIVMKLLNVNPDNRYQNSLDLLNDIELLIDKSKSHIDLKENKNYDYSDEFYEYIINDSLKEAFYLAKCENKLIQAIEILESEMLQDYDIRNCYDETLRMWKSEMPDIKLISKAFTVNLRGQNYEMSSNLLKEAIAYNPSIKVDYDYYFDLWDIFVDLQKNHNLIKAVISLEDLMNSNKNIHDIYSNVINVLKTYSVDYIASEAIRLAKLNNLPDASVLMEFAVVYDYEMRQKYSYRLSLWKQNMKMYFKASELKENTIDYAMDLGTTDSVISYFNNGNPIVIKNHRTGDEFTPSAVLIDENNEVHVGQVARNEIVDDSKNAISEFKNNMGFSIPFKFEKSNVVLYPEELSAEVLKDLRLSVYNQCGVNMEHAVICVPANSNPMKTKAVNDAARLAGFKSHNLILEPIAVAFAYDLKMKSNRGLWMIYDLGGGTFNVSLIKDNCGEIEKVDTAGLDNLGGNIFDWLIIDELLVPKISNDLKLDDFSRNNRKYSKIFSKLKLLCEIAKKELSNSSETDICVHNLFENYDLKYTLKKEVFKKTISPYIKTTFNLCWNLLNENNISTENLDNIILVGGSCLSPVVKELLHEEFDVDLEYSINPLTVVAEGAAIYAGSLEKPKLEYASEEHSLIINKKDSQVDGRLFTLNPNFVFIGYKMEFKNEEESKLIPIGIDGTFNTLVDFEWDSIEISNNCVSIEIKNEFSSDYSDLMLNDLISDYKMLLKKIDLLREHNDFKNDDTLAYVGRLIELAKIDNLAINPLQFHLKRMKKIIKNAEDDFEFSKLLENINEKFRIVSKNNLFDISDLKLEKAIENRDLDALNEIYTKLIERYVEINKNEVIELCFFNLVYDGVYSNSEHVDKLFEEGLESIQNNNYVLLLGIVNELYGMDMRN